MTNTQLDLYFRKFGAVENVYIISETSENNTGSNGVGLLVYSSRSESLSVLKNRFHHIEGCLVEVTQFESMREVKEKIMANQVSRQNLSGTTSETEGKKTTSTPSSNTPKGNSSKTALASQKNRTKRDQKKKSN